MGCADFMDTYEVLAVAILAGKDPAVACPQLWHHALHCPRCGLALALLADLLGNLEAASRARLPNAAGVPHT